MTSNDQPLTKGYRIDFVLILLTGNITRYQILRPKVEAVMDLVSRWYPVRTWFDEDPLRILPGALRLRLRHLLDTRHAYTNRPPQAIVIHAFETYYLLTLFHRLLRRKIVIVVNPDGAIHKGRNALSSFLFQYAVRNTDLFIPWSHYCAEGSKENYPSYSEIETLILHPGIDIQQWPMRVPREPGERFKLLFVGGDALRKGLATLLTAFEQKLSSHCDLDIVTQPGYMTQELQEHISRLPHTCLHLDVSSGSEELKRLYRECDAFVLPTNSDSSSWVAIESMATGIPVVITSVGGIPDIVINGETGMIVPPRDPVALAEAVESLRTSPELRRRLIAQGRAHIEANFNADINTTRMLAAIKAKIDQKQVK